MLSSENKDIIIIIIIIIIRYMYDFKISIWNVCMGLIQIASEKYANQLSNPRGHNSYQRP